MKGPMRRMAAFFLIGALAYFSMGADCHDETRKVNVGQPFELRIGESASVADGQLVLKFVSVSRDNRCPRGDQCIVAGSALILLEAAAGGETAQGELDTARGESSQWDVSGFQITLLDVQPYPSSGRSTQPNEYVARLSVQRP
jgi:hypothetical protein